MTTTYDFQKEWTREYLSYKDLTYPAEYVIRMFKGAYPRLNLRDLGYEGKTICDVGCGDGVNLHFLSTLGLDIYGVEVSEPIVEKARFNLEKLGAPKFDLRVGTNDQTPFEDNAFDFLLSWNSCYYLGADRDFDRHVAEFARITKPGGHLVMSIPKKTCFIYHGSETLKPGYQVIKNDPFNVRNGEVLRMFEDEADIERTFASHFGEFVFGSVHDECFGYDYHWHLVVCRKK